jgi:hypothetical protein
MDKKMANWMNHELKGKKNKLKIGDTVRAKPSWVDWHSSRISWLFGKRVENDGSYLENEKEIPLESLSEAHFLTYSKLSGKMPTGIISRYGADDNDDNISRKNVYVTFTLNTELGDIQYSCYVAEKDLELIKKAKSRK